MSDMTHSMTEIPSLPFDLTGHIAWVTGSSSGIGHAIARLFAGCGADVVIHGLDEREAIAALQAEIEGMGRRTLAVEGDLTDATCVDALVEQIGARFGNLSILVNCVGGSPWKAPVVEMTEAHWDRLIKINLKSQFLVTRAALPLLAEARRASIVNVSSCVTRTGGVRGGTAYATAKGGVDVLTRSLARELAPAGIRVNGVAPGLVDSPFHSVDVQEKYSGLIERIPLGRIGRPEDLAGPAVFLASDAAAYITGEIIEVSGGTRLVS